MAASTVTQITSGTSTTDTTAVAFTAQASGTVLVLTCTANQVTATSGDDRPESSGWTLIASRGTYTGCHAMWYKVANGTEVSVSYRLVNTVSSCYSVLTLTNIDTTTPLDNANSQTIWDNDTPYSTYTTPTLPLSPTSQVAIASIGGARTNTSFTNVSSWTNSYTGVGFVAASTEWVRPGFANAYCNLSGGGALTNLALSATATASTENAGTGQTADKAIDGVIDGWPGDHTREWATLNGGVGSWIQLDWASPVVLSQIVLYDRPNTDDQITGGTLLFSDGTTVTVPSLNNDGSAVTINFTSRATSYVRFTVTSIGAWTGNAGLAEFQAWGNAGTSTVATYTPDAYVRSSIIALFNVVPDTIPLPWTI